MTGRSTTSAPAPPDPAMGRLPGPATSFVGRAVERAAVRTLLAHAHVVTLTGPGGVGKTRLALEVARECSASYTDGAWMVDLSSRTSGDEIWEAISEALSLERTDRRSPTADGVVGYLRHRSMLLVLDTCEHLVEASAAAVARILRECAAISVLATSRRLLEVEGEHDYVVGGLGTPLWEAEAPPPGEGDAIELFVHRARAVRPGFALDEQNRYAVAELCRRLDGLPLAIELAAVRLRSLSPEEILSRIRDRFALLNLGPRTAAPRQQTLRAVIEWSYRLCAPSEQALWRACSCFAGGFDLAAIEGVLARQGDPGSESRGPLDLVDQLVAQSVLIADLSNGRTRYRMLDTLRDYGADRLYAEEGASGHADLRTRHRDYYRANSAALVTNWWGPGQKRVLRRLRADHPNLRAAIDWSLATPGQEPAALEILASLRYFWLVGGYLGEGDRRLSTALKATESASLPVRAEALCTAAWIAVLRGETRAAQKHLDQCDTMARNEGDSGFGAFVVLLRGAVELFDGNLVEAEAFLGTARGLPPTGADPGTTLFATFLLALTQVFAGEVGTATRTCEDGLKLSAELDEHWVQGYLTWTGALAEMRSGRRPGARSGALTALASFADLDDHIGAALCVELLAWLAAEEGNRSEGCDLLAAADVLWEVLGTCVRNFGPDFAAAHDLCLTKLGLPGQGRSVTDGAPPQSAPRTPREAITRALASGRAEDITSRGPATLLTRRQREVADMIADGRTNREIAASLVVSLRTVEGHVEQILRRLGCRSRTEIALLLIAGAEEQNGRATPRATPPPTTSG